jgi:uncharacterized protein YbjQ (UPF0145 family)
VGGDLDAYAKDADKTRKQAIHRLRKEMKALSAGLDSKVIGNGLVKTFEGWWDRISELMR